MQNNKNIEKHLLSPFIPNGAKILILGAFPPKRDKWSMEFYYPNYINDMWRIFGYILHRDKDYFVDTEAKCFNLPEIKMMLSTLKIAVGDTAQEIERLRDNASDKYLKVHTSIDLPKILNQIPGCIAIVTTGEKAASIISELTFTDIPAVGTFNEISVNDRILRHYRMPSSSRAYPMKLEKKAEYYENMLRQIGIL